MDVSIDNKYNWVYQNSMILNLQNIEWSLERTPTFNYGIKNLNTHEHFDRIFIKDDPTIKEVITIYLNKGDIKWESSTIDGIVKLKLYSMISNKLSKYVGILKVECAKNFIAGLSLSYTNNDIKDAPKEVLNKIGKSHK